MVVRRRLAAFEELLFFLFFVHFHRIHGVHRLHLFQLLWGDFRKMTDEVNELPVVSVVMPSGIAPRRHSGEANAVLDDGEQLTVAQILRALTAHVRRLWI